MNTCEDSFHSPDINNIPPISSSASRQKGEFLFRDTLWPVWPKEADQDPKMMKRIFETVEQVLTLSSRLFAVRYDLHLSEYQADNRIIDQFHRLLFVQLHRKYPKSFVGYLWVREKKSAKAQHYHYVLMMDGNYIRYPSKLTELIQQCWHQAAGKSVWVTENCFYFVQSNDIETYGKLMFRLSYLGKRQTKEPTSKCRKRLGWGIRQYKRKTAVRTQRVPADITISNEMTQTVEMEAFHDERPSKPTEKTRDCYSSLDKLFLGKLTLESLKPAAKPTKKKHDVDWLNFDFDRVWREPRPDWGWHRQNYLFEVMSKGVSLSEYAKQYKLKLRRVYANFRKIGGQSLRMLHWAWHRRCYRQSSLSVDEYISRNGLEGASVSRQLKRLPMSEYWKQHFDHYYQNFWPTGWTVRAYCEIHDVHVSTARRYLVDFPKTCLFHPLILKPWL